DQLLHGFSVLPVAAVCHRRKFFRSQHSLIAGAERAWTDVPGLSHFQKRLFRRDVETSARAACTHSEESIAALWLYRDVDLVLRCEFDGTRVAGVGVPEDACARITCEDAGQSSL